MGAAGDNRRVGQVPEPGSHALGFKDGLQFIFIHAGAHRPHDFPMRPAADFVRPAQKGEFARRFNGAQILEAVAERVGAVLLSREKFSEFAQVLKEASDALENQDQVLLADVMEYDLAEGMSVWRRLIELMIEKITEMERKDTTDEED